MTAPGPGTDTAPAAPAEGAEAVRGAIAAARRGNDPGRWPEKLPVADRLAVLLDDAFNVPLIFLHDVPGFMVGAAVERQGIIRHGAKTITAIASAEVSRFAVILRKSYAAGYYAMCAPGFEPRASIALPTASVGPIAAEASVSAMYARKIAEIADPQQRAAFTEARLAEQRADINLLRLASELVVDAVVEPADLRAELIARLADAARWDPRTEAAASSQQPRSDRSPAHRVVPPGRMSMADNLSQLLATPLQPLREQVQQAVQQAVAAEAAPSV